jgi:hypothetical protein
MASVLTEASAKVREKRDPSMMIFPLIGMDFLVATHSDERRRKIREAFAGPIGYLIVIFTFP